MFLNRVTPEIFKNAFETFENNYGGIKLSRHKNFIIQ